MHYKNDLTQRLLNFSADVIQFFTYHRTAIAEQYPKEFL